LVVCDEADTLEQELMRHVAVEVSDRRMREFGIDKPKVTVAEDWVRWARDEALPAAQAALANVPPGMDEVDAIRRENALGRLVGRLGYLANGEAINKWVYAGAGKRKTDDMTVAFKPFVVDHLAQEYLWETGQRWLCMSATVISRDVEAMALGLDPDDVPLVSVPNTFPVENRPIHIETVAELTYDKEFRSFRPKDLEAAARKVEEIGLAHPDERILVHTVSFVLARYFMENCPRIRHRFVMYEDSKGRDEVLRKFTTTPAAICLAPSFERGIDLPGDLCRVNVIAKIPFPSLGDPLVDARLRRTANGDEWYRVQTVRRLVQATGRATRSADDWSKTYIIDRSFITKVWRKSRKYLPKWWKDAIVWKRGQVGRG
jgi:Rad3-related DNA helicase